MGRKEKKVKTQEEEISELDVRTQGVTDAKDLEPVTLGILRKEKIGNPLLAVELFVMLVVVLASMGAITESLTSNDGFLHGIIYGVTGIDTSTDPQEQKGDLNLKITQKLTDESTFVYDNIVIKKVKITENYMEGLMATKNNQEINLDELELYMLIYPPSDQSEGAEVGIFKLSGTISSVDTQFKYTLAGVNFNDRLNYFGKVKDYKNLKYPTKTLELDEAGKAKLTCSKDDRVIEYVFKGIVLTEIHDRVTYLHSSAVDNNVYLKDYNAYEQKKQRYGDIATIEETDDGFVYVCNIDLTVEGFKYPAVNDPEYYSPSLSAESTDIEVIHFAMTGKGYDCK